MTANSLILFMRSQVKRSCRSQLLDMSRNLPSQFATIDYEWASFGQHGLFPYSLIGRLVFRQRATVTHATSNELAAFSTETLAKAFLRPQTFALTISPLCKRQVTGGNCSRTDSGVHNTILISPFLYEVLLTVMTFETSHNDQNDCCYDCYIKPSHCFVSPFNQSNIPQKSIGVKWVINYFLLFMTLISDINNHKNAARFFQRAGEQSRRHTTSLSDSKRNTSFENLRLTAVQSARLFAECRRDSIDRNQLTRRKILASLEAYFLRSAFAQLRCHA